MISKCIPGVLFLLVSIYCEGQSIIIDLNDSNRQEVLDVNNLYRWALNLDSVSYNYSLEKEAKEWALVLAEKDRLIHAISRNKHGENLAKASYVFSVVDATNMWGIERLDYNHFTRHKKNVVGHYTQMVWQGTSEIGCALAKNEKGNYFSVCRYNPHGNIIRKYPFGRFRGFYYFFRKKYLPN